MPLPNFHPAGLVVRRIGDIKEKLASDQLVRRMYAWRGYQASSRASSLHDKEHITLAVWQHNELAATLTISQDSERGLLCETLYPNEITALRQKSQRLCECTRLAIDPAFRSPTLLEALFRNAYRVARAHFGATDAVIEVNPRHCRYYERELGFAQVGPRRICPRVEAPAMLLHRDLHRPLNCALEVVRAA